MGLLDRLFNTDKKILADIEKKVKPTEDYSKQMEELSDEELRAKTDEFRNRLKNGETLGIFPEGTRKGLAKGAKVQNGAAYMAIKTKVKVVPVGIQGNFKPFTKVKLNYGKPLDFTKLDSKNPEKDNLEQATKEIMDNIVMLTKQEK